MGVPAIGAAGWFDPELRCLIGTCCDECGTTSFPPELRWCRNPSCSSESLSEVSLGSSGTVWSFTTAAYQPPSPFVPADLFEPFVIVAVQLDDSGIVVIGRAAERSSVEGLLVGQRAELDVGVLFAADGVDQLMWQWRIEND